MPEQTYESEQDPEERLLEQEQALDEMLNDVENEKEPGHQGRESVEDDSVDEMLVHIEGDD